MYSQIIVPLDGMGFAARAPPPAVQLAERRHIGLAELEVEQRKVFLYAVRSNRFREDNVAALDMPPQYHLRR